MDYEMVLKIGYVMGCIYVVFWIWQFFVSICHNFNMLGMVREDAVEKAEFEKLLDGWHGLTRVQQARNANILGISVWFIAIVAGLRKRAKGKQNSNRC